MSSPSFKISNARRIDKRSLVGAVDIELPSGLKINGLMLLESHGKRWLNFPSKEWTKEDGSKGYSPLLEFSTREAHDRFQALVMPLVEQALGLMEAAP
jgi:hypothetical protein